MVFTAGRTARVCLWNAVTAHKILHKPRSRGSVIACPGHGAGGGPAGSSAGGPADTRCPSPAASPPRSRETARTLRETGQPANRGRPVSRRSCHRSPSVRILSRASAHRSFAKRHLRAARFQLNDRPSDRYFSRSPTASGTQTLITVIRWPLLKVVRSSGSETEALSRPRGLAAGGRPSCSATRQLGDVKPRLGRVPQGGGRPPVALRLVWTKFGKALVEGPTVTLSLRRLHGL